MKNTEINENTNTIEHERIVRLIESIENDVRSLRHLLVSHSLTSMSGTGIMDQIPTTTSETAPVPVGFMQVAQRVEEESIEGIFDGERMLDQNGKSYQVPPNYASKSKLVEGDPLKLYITHDGKYLYKQLGPVERITLPGLLRMEGNHYVVDAEDGQTYNVLTACVTYYMSLYNLKAGDKVMIVIPAGQPSKWAVIDNLI